MKPQWTYHKSLEHLHVGCDAPHAYFIPYTSVADADRDQRAASERFFSLCGTWDFRFYPSVEEVEDFTADGWEMVQADKLDVPSSWQVALGRGYDMPQYVNTEYPFAVDPPFVPEENPAGLYRRRFFVEEESLKGRDLKLVFEGVDSCFYVYINNRFVGYSQVSHMTSEFSVREFVTAGENEIKVLVLKWCDGTYLECQDKIRLSGIFREVYLLSHDARHLTDLYVRTALNEDLSKAEISVDLEANAALEVGYRLLCPCGKTVAEGTATVDPTATLSLSLEQPMLWSDEIPTLYALYLTAGEEIIRQEIGVRRIEVKGRVIYLNGQKIKAKGVNRHDSHPQLGYATPMDHMLRDLYVMKRHNVNMIRTSHYPNDPRFLTLCDRLGFLVCDEADLETHGMVCVKNWNRLTDSPEWTEAYLDRAARMMERDKNHPSIVMWSVGNESGVGQNHRRMAAYFHERMPGCLVHSEDASRAVLPNHLSEDPAVRRDVNVEYIDLDSRMYPTLEETLDLYLKNKNSKLPFFMCEYSHAMGNGPGDLEAYWKLIYKYDCFFGGCVWEFTDHSVDIGTPEKPKYVYGGDLCGEKINSGNFCVDGLVYPDRRPHVGLLELKQVYRPVRLTASNAETGKITLRNHRYFTSLSDLDLYWTVEQNGKVIREGRIPALAIAPQRSRTYILDLGSAERAGACYLNLSFRSNRSTAWEGAGYEVCFEQIELPASKIAPSKAKRSANFALCEEEHFFRITDGACVWTVDRRTGLISSIMDHGKEMLTSPVTPNVWRAPIDNDAGSVPDDWNRRELLRRVRPNCSSCTVLQNSAEGIVLASELMLGAEARLPLIRMTVRYRFVSGCGVVLSCEGSVKELKSFLPRLGFVFTCPEGFERLRYFAKGPTESYEDKQNAARYGEYETTVTAHFEHYVRPQENMAHVGTRWMEVATEGGHGLLATGADGLPSFSFNCSHFTDEQLTATKHDYELVPRKETVVHLDWRQSGVGSHSCGPRLAEEYRVKPSAFAFSLRLTPVFVNNVDPYGEMDR